MKRETIPAAGVYLNGAVYWLRTVRAPLSGRTKRLSTGTRALERANAIRGMVRDMEQNPTQYRWLDLAMDGAVSLDRLYVHHAAGTLQELHAQLNAAKYNEDLRPVVASWLKELGRRSLDVTTVQGYTFHIRVLIPDATPFPASRFTRDVLAHKLDALKVSDLTKKHYAATWRAFYTYAAERVAHLPNPFIGAAWTPRRVSSRSPKWEWEQVKAVVLDRMTGTEQAAMALLFGSGMELGALIDLRREHIGSDAERTVIAPGSKNEHREARTIFVDAWAWTIFRAYLDAHPGSPREAVFPYSDVAKPLREAFYAAQVAAGLIDAPPMNKTTNKRLWAQVNPHHIHDARHTYCVVRALGLDGEDPQDITFLSAQLGHADEQMVMKIYKKRNLKERAKLLARQRQMQQETK